LLDLQERWRHSHHVPAECYLRPPAGEGVPYEDAVALVLVEREARREAGEDVSAAGFLRRFPQYGDQLADQLAIQDAGWAAAGEDHFPPVPPRYEIKRLLGAGSFGRVYEAHDRDLERPVALKVMTGFGDPRAAERFWQEATSLARVRHPNVVEVYEVGVHDGLLYLSMGLMPGGTTVRDLVNGLVNDPRAAAGLLVKVARAVQACHQHSIVHRDLKPENILLDEGGEPHVSDFGLAKRLEGGRRLTRSGAMVGTPGYMAPEQFGRGSSVTTAADVYALGVILYELLTGELPFKGSVYDVMLQVTQRDAASPLSVNGAADPDLAAVAMKCLEKEPEQRYHSAEAVADDVERWLRGEPVLARPVGWAGRLRRLARRKPALAATFGAGAIAAAVITALSFYSVWQRAAASEERSTRLSGEAEFHRQEVIQEQRRVTQVTAAYVEATQNLYTARMALTEKDYQDSNLDRAAATLDDCVPGPGKPDYRGWEWYYLKRLIDPPPGAVGGTGGTEQVAFSPDGRHLVCLQTGGGVTVVPLAGGPRIRLTGAGKDNRSLAVSPGGTRVAAGSEDGTVEAWDLSGRPGGAADIRPRWTWRVNAVLVRLLFLRDDLLVSTEKGKDGGTIALWDLKPGEEPRRRDVPGQWGSAVSLATNPSRSVVAVATGRTISLCDPQLRALFRIEVPEFAKDTTLQGIMDVAVSPDERAGATPLVAAACSDNVIRVWKMDPAAPVLREPAAVLRGHTSLVSGVAFHPQKKVIVSSSWDRTVRMWDVETARELAVLRGHRKVVQSLAVSPDGRLIASAGSAGDGVRLWKPRDPRATTLSHAYALGCLAVSADGKYLVCGGGAYRQGLGEAWLWDIAGDGPQFLGELKGGHKGGVMAISFHPDGNLIATAATDKAVILWDAGKRAMLEKLNHHTNTVQALSFSPDGGLLASGGRDGTVALWDVATRKLVRTLPARDGAGGEEPGDHTPWINGLAFSPAGRFLADAGGDGTVRIWDVPAASLARTLKAHSRNARLAYSRDGSLLATVGSEDGTLKVWDPGSGAALRTLSGLESPMGVAIDPTASRVATASGNEVKFWDWKWGAEMLTLHGHKHYVTALAFEPSGRRLFSASYDKTVRVWDARPAGDAP
jgi:WD40 repeat protein